MEFEDLNSGEKYEVTLRANNTDKGSFSDLVTASSFTSLFLCFDQA